MKSPCSPYPDDASYKTISVWCPHCDTFECWRRYLSWEKAVGVTLNASSHPDEIDDDHKERAVSHAGAPRPPSNDPLKPPIIVPVRLQTRDVGPKR